VDEYIPPSDVKSMAEFGDTSLSEFKALDVSKKD
jgi:hypothetical protein